MENTSNKFALRMSATVTCKTKKRDGDITILLSVQFKNLGISHVGILSWGNLIHPTSYIDFSVKKLSH